MALKTLGLCLGCIHVQIIDHRFQFVSSNAHHHDSSSYASDSLSSSSSTVGLPVSHSYVITLKPTGALLWADLCLYAHSLEKGSSWYLFDSLIFSS